MKKYLSLFLVFAMIAMTATTAFAASDLESAFSFAEAKEKGILYDKPLKEKSRNELINEGALFYGGTVPWSMSRATVNKAYGYVVNTGKTYVYSGMGSGSTLGYLTINEIVYVDQIVGDYAKITFKNASGNLTSGYVSNNAVYTPAYNWYRPIIKGTANQFYGQISVDGSQHTGVDVAAPSGTGVYAVNKGTVQYKESYKEALSGKRYFVDYGKHAELTFTENGKSMKIVYAHLSKFGNNVSSHDYTSALSKNLPAEIKGVPTNKINMGSPISVTKASTLGYVGTTGNSTGNHLHFEVRVVENGRDKLYDPFLYVVFPDIQWAE